MKRVASIRVPRLRHLMVTLMALPLFVPPAHCDGQQTPPQGKTIEIKIEKKKYVPPGRTPKIPDEFRKESIRFVVRAGDTIKICNNDRFFAKPMSLSEGNKFEGLSGPGGLHPGDCITYVVKNDSGKPIRFFLHDEMHARTKLFMVVLPANAPDQGEEDTPAAPYHTASEYAMTEGGEIIDAEDEAEIEVTVLGKDSTDEKSKPAPIKGAYVKAGPLIAETYGDGVATLNAEFPESQEVTVEAKGYKTQTQNVRVNKRTAMSAASGKATFILEPELSDKSPQLDKHWSDLLAAINDLEPRVMAWNNKLTEMNQVLQGIAKLQDEIAKINQSATKDSDQLDQLRQALSGVNGKTAAQMRCETAAQLKKNIEEYSKEATDKEKELRETIDQAKGMSATCSKVWEAEAIGKLYEEAIRVTAAIGLLEKKAVKDGNALNDLAKEHDELKDTTGEVENKLADLVLDATQADKLAADAEKALLRAREMTKISKGDYPALRAELAKLKKTFALDPPPADVPEELLKRVTTMDQILSKKSGDVFSAPGLDSVEGIQKVANEVKRKKDDAQKRLNEFKADKKNTCTIDSMDDTVDAIGAIVTGATLELGAAADLPTMANACLAKANEVEVPDLASLNDLGAMMRAADQVGMKFHAVATNAAPPAKSQRLFGPQDPPAKSKAHRGDSLTILVYQKLAEQTATPAPTPIAVSSATPTPTATASVTPTPAQEDDMVDVPSATGAKSIESAGILLRQAGFVPIFKAIAPKKKEDELTFASQDPVGQVKKSFMQQRGNKVYVYVYQKFDDTQAQETPTPTPTASEKASPTPEPTPDSQPDSSPQSGPTDITNTTGGEFWKGKTPPTKKPTPSKKATPPPNKNKKTSDWWRKHGHDRPDYEVPNN